MEPDRLSWQQCVSNSGMNCVTDPVLGVARLLVLREFRLKEAKSGVGNAS